MKEKIVTLESVSKQEAIEIAGSLKTMDETKVNELFTSIIHSLEKTLLQNQTDNIKTEEISSFLRIISRRIQRESKKADAWRFYLYGRYDSIQEKLIEEIRDTQKNGKRKQILSKKNVPQILQFLYRNGASRHMEIARGIRMDPANLSRVMELLLEENLVERTKIGKSSFTIYELTRDGYQVCTSYYRKKAIMENDSLQYMYLDVGDFKEVGKEKIEKRAYKRMSEKTNNNNRNIEKEYIAMRASLDHKNHGLVQDIKTPQDFYILKNYPNPQIGYLSRR